MKIEKLEYEELIRDSEKLRHVVSIVLGSKDSYVDRGELLRACGLGIKEDRKYVA